MGSTPIEQLDVLATQELEVTPDLAHLELYTMSGLLTVLWHGRGEVDAAVVACGGAMGGLLGPGGGLYHDLGVELAAQGIATLRVSWRRANDLAACVLDAAVAVQMVAGRGAKRVVVLGHSFGGAVAVQLALALPELVVGCVTFATQSAGCEAADQLDEERCQLLLFHGDRDELLPPACSELVHRLAGYGELVVLPGTGHLMSEAGDELRTRLSAWIPAVLS